MEKTQASVKAKLEVIQRMLSKLGQESGPARLAKIFGVAQSSIFRWLKDEVQPREKQAERVDLLYRAAREARAGNPKAKEIFEKLIDPASREMGVDTVVLGAVSSPNLLSFGLLGVIAAAGFRWLLSDSDKEYEDEDEE